MFGLPIKERVLKHVGSVIVQEGVLLPRKVAHAHAGIDSPRIEKLVPNRDTTAPTTGTSIP